MRIRLSPLAKRDLVDIWVFGAEMWGEARADVYLDGLRDRMKWLTLHTSLWRPREDIASALFSYPHESHVLFFRKTDQSLEIARILHERMDFGDHV